MRVLAVTYCRAMLGANRALLLMMKDMRKRYGVEFTVLMPEVKDGDLAEVLEQEGFSYHIAAMKMWVMPLQAKYKKLRSISAQVKTFFLSRKILRELKSEEYDLIYTNNSTVQYGSIIAKQRKLPHVWHVREVGRYHYDFDYSYPDDKRIAYFNEASAVVVISEFVRKYAEEELCPGSNIVRIYDGIDVPAIYNEESKREKEQVFRFVCVAALQQGKNQMELIMAAERLRDSGETGFEVCLIGDGAEYRAELEMYVAQHRLSSVVKFYGYRKDVRALFQEMDVGVLCSRAEGFGLVTCEYMAAKLPVIGADSGATPELVKDGVTGYLYPSGNVSKLTECMKSLLSNRDSIDKLGTAGYNRVKEQFELKRNTDGLYSIFSQFAGSKILS